MRRRVGAGSGHLCRNFQRGMGTRVDGSPVIAKRYRRDRLCNSRLLPLLLPEWALDRLAESSFDPLRLLEVKPPDDRSNEHSEPCSIGTRSSRCRFGIGASDLDDKEHYAKPELNSQENLGQP